MILKHCRHFLMLILGTFALPAGLRAADDLPKSFDFIRYESITKKSPFAVATAAAPVATAASFAKDLYRERRAFTGRRSRDDRFERGQRFQKISDDQ